MNPSQLLTRLRTVAGALTSTQIATLAGTFVLVVSLLVGSTYWLNAPTYRLLFADMDAEAAASVVSRLKTLKVAYRLDEGGRSIRVPADRVDELRLDFAAEGLPSSGRIGFEIFDRTTFGATEFLEQVNYRRALEGEIARTISTISEVAGARVHLAMAKDSLFGVREQPAKASVVLKLRSRQMLPPATVNAIVSMVSASVEGLNPESIVVMDSFGRPLYRQVGDQDQPLNGVQVEQQQQFERDMTTRVVALLEPVVGVGRVRANVTARFNPNSEEQTDERWDPEQTVIRSRQVTTDGRQIPQAQGVAGSRGNLPAPADSTAAPTAPPPVAAPSPTQSRMAETTNYEISKSVRHTIRPPGDLARLSVAVLVDDERVTSTDAQGNAVHSNKPREAAEIQKIQGLVAAAVGLDSSRGDQLTVENISFDDAPLFETPPEPWWQRFAPQILQALRIFAVTLLGLLAFVFVVRPLMRRVVGSVPVTTATAELPTQLPRTVEELQGELEAQLEADGPLELEQAKVTVLSKRLAAMTQKEPESTARLIRSWLTEEGR